MLSVFGIHHLENLNLAAMARDQRLDLVRDGRCRRATQGAAGAVIRPVAIGLPGQR